MALTILLKKCYLLQSAAVATKEETKGTIGTYLDFIYPDLFAGEKTYESAEQAMCKKAIEIAKSKAKLDEKKIDIAFGGDLLNQIFISSSVSMEFSYAFGGVYGACSTSMLSLALASVFVSSDYASYALAFTSSNYGSAERQFRYPTSYGIKKKETTTLTVSGAGAAIVTKKKTDIKIVSATFGKVYDSCTYDVSDMGSIMALAAYHTIEDHLKYRNQNFDDYDLILTGDLSLIGSEVLKDLLERKNLSMLEDAGNWVYNPKKRKKFSGGSGCACLALSAYTKVVAELKKGNYRHVLLVGTGALHSKVSASQQKNIPVIAHAVELRKETQK